MSLFVQAFEGLSVCMSFEKQVVSEEGKAFLLYCERLGNRLEQRCMMLGLGSADVDGVY